MSIIATTDLVLHDTVADKDFAVKKGDPIESPFMYRAEKDNVFCTVESGNGWTHRHLIHKGAILPQGMSDSDLKSKMEKGLISLVGPSAEGRSAK